MPTRSQIVACARSFLGTPFKHQGRIKGMALDCVGLPLMIGEELKLLDCRGEPFSARDNADYSPQPMGRFVHEECQRRLYQKSHLDMMPGDVVTLRNPTDPCHVAIVAELNGYTSMIHAYGGGPKKTVEHIMDEKWKRRIEGIFFFPGIEG